MKISFLLTGNELMSGDTVDSNSAAISQSLKDINLVPIIKKVVGDDLPMLVSSIKELADQSDVLIVNGGLGPTVDDLTAQALSQATSSELVQHPEALSHLEQWAAPRGFVLTESNLKQAELPAICDVIPNPHGSAVGFQCIYNGCLILCTPGVPSELIPMVENHLLPRIKEYGSIEASNHITRLRLFGITESGLQDIVNNVFPDWPAEVDLGFRVQLPLIEVKLTTVGDQHLALNQQWTDKFSQHFSDYIVGRDGLRLSQALNNALLQANKKISVAESCTGGAIAAGITSEAGSSAVFEAGFITYANQIKQSVLGVSEQSLQQHGAVSEAVVKEMVAGALRVSGADIAVATSGIAGPTGGSDTKPVGTVWLAWGSGSEIRARRFYLPIGRVGFQRTVTAIAMDLVRREILGLPTDVDYFSELKRQN